MGQRRHDALNDLALDFLSNQHRAERGGDRPNVVVRVNADSGVAYTSGEIVLPTSIRDEMLCDATVTTVWVNRSGVPFDVGTPESSIPARNRRAVTIRDRGCRYPGCCRPARWSDIHHIRYREHGGTHQIDNLAMLCRFHHRLVHRLGLKLRFDQNDDITLLVEWPNGIIMHSPPPHDITPTT